MFDYEFITVRSFDGTNRTERAVEVFNTVTGTTVAVVRRAYQETKEAWVKRAFWQARMEVA